MDPHRPPPSTRPTLEHQPHPWLPGISDSVRVRHGDLLVVSGQTASPPVDKAFTDELDAALACLDAALRRAGAQWADVVRLTFFVVDLPSRSLDDIRAVRDRWLVEGRLPASSIIGVAALALPELRVEVEALAVV